MKQETMASSLTADDPAGDEEVSGESAKTSSATDAADDRAVIENREDDDDHGAGIAPETQGDTAPGIQDAPELQGKSVPEETDDVAPEVKLEAAPVEPEGPVPENSWEWEAFFRSIALSADLDRAAEVIAQQVSQFDPRTVVRIAYGGRDAEGRPVIRGVYDVRFGWLRRENTIFQSVQQRFDRLFSADEIPIDSSGVISGTSETWVPLQSPEDGGRLGVLCLRVTDAGAEADSETDETTPEGLTLPPDSDLTKWQTVAAIWHSRPASLRLARIADRVRYCWARRGTFGIACVLILLLCCIPARYRSLAVVNTVARDSRLVAAPIAATLAEVHKLPGDFVREGEPLLRLDGRPLRIELQGVVAEIEEATKEEDIALAGGKIAEAQLAGLRRKSLLRRRDLLTDRLEKLVVLSPIDGVVIQGDLRKSLGTPLEVGQTVMEIAPDGALEFEYEIPEVEIGFVQPGAEVDVWFPGLRATDVAVQVDEIWPSATVREDANVFIARSRVGSSDGEDDGADTPSNASVIKQGLRVGMRGEAVVYGPVRPWIWKYVRVPLCRLGWIFGW